MGKAVKTAYAEFLVEEWYQPYNGWPNCPSGLPPEGGILS